MSVTKAAQLIGVGRPTLSNLLNGKTALSPDMAARLEKAFGFPREELMEMQARYDLGQAKRKNAPAETKAYVPPFLSIKAKDVENWISRNISARPRLSVLLRTLVHSTGSGLTRVDFPGNDDAERPGWDGFVEAAEGTPWVPSGHSGWEFGTNEAPKAKAEGDFQKSVKAHSKEARAKTTFVFVTPRHWPGKTVWVASKKTKALWKDVRAYDSSDLEQWLEQSLPAQTWLANEADLPTQHVRSLDKCWADWANVTKPALTGTLFGSAIEAAKRTMLSALSKPPERPISVAADSAGEALAFLTQLFGERGGENLSLFRDRVLVFDKPGVLPRIATGAQAFIPVVFTRDVERELGPHSKSMHSIVIYPRNAVSAGHDIVLEPANYEAFAKALEEIGNNRDEIARLAHASGRSLTVLRRQLSTVHAVRTPAWSSERETARSLVPFLFLGTWNSQNETDREGLSLLAKGRPYAELENDCQNLAQLDDAPIWSIGHYRGVISKIDLLFAIAIRITPDDLSHYFQMAYYVLSEDDPALDLPEHERWAAAIHGKTREFSASFREGISETLVLLAVHGNHLFKDRLGIDVEAEAARIVNKLLPSPLTPRTLEANHHDFPTYAEAAPFDFLSIIERDLKTETPAVLTLLRPADAGILGRGPGRAGLLWALESLSWSPTTLPRATHILARLAEVEIQDNWVNKPMNSLQAIFRAWMPQTAADHKTRVELLKKLARDFPRVTWKLCMAELGAHGQVGEYSQKPRWRPDGYGFGEPFPTTEPIIAFIREVVELALNWKGHSLGMLCDLVERLEYFTEADQARVWDLVEVWARTTASDAEKAEMRERIRTSTLSRRAVLRLKKNAKAAPIVAAGKSIVAALEPCDLLNRHAWLFREQWVEESADEIDDTETFDFRKREDEIRSLRTAALLEIREKLGLEGLLALSVRGKCSGTIGWLAARFVLPEADLEELLRVAFASILAGGEGSHQHRPLISGALHGIEGDPKRTGFLRRIGARLSEAEFESFLELAPYRKNTWLLVDELGSESQAKYWSSVSPDWIQDAELENADSIERLLKVGRPRAAFACARFTLKQLDTSILVRLLTEMAKGGNDKNGDYPLREHDILEAFNVVNQSDALTLDQKAECEFAYIDVLARPWSRRGIGGIPNLERYVESHPEFFIQTVAWTYKRSDGAKDPDQFLVPPDRVTAMAERGHRVLEGIRRIPGHDDFGELRADRLSKWIATVRQSCIELSRTYAGDSRIGHLLAHAPVGADGVWPCEPVRDVMEEIQSDIIMNGARTGVYNSRGAQWRGEGGDQERELAGKYRRWSEALQVSHPFVASKLLLVLAKTYENEASGWDTEAEIRRRLPY
jgi:addiction module HigA family antidote